MPDALGDVVSIRPRGTHAPVTSDATREGPSVRVRDEISAQARLNVQGTRGAGLLPCQLGQGLTQQPPLLLGHEPRSTQDPGGASAGDCNGQCHEGEDAGKKREDLMGTGEEIARGCDGGVSKEGDGENQARYRQRQRGEGLQQPQQPAPTKQNGRRRRARIIGGDGLIHGLTHLLLTRRTGRNSQTLLDECKAGRRPHTGLEARNVMVLHVAAVS